MAPAQSLTAEPPSAEQIRQVREAAGLTQAAAAALIYCAAITWRQWEAGAREMHPAFWELFNLKTTYKHHSISLPA